MNVDIGTAEFLQYENLELSLPARKTTNDDMGVFEIKITLNDKGQNVEVNYSILLTILPVD